MKVMVTTKIKDKINKGGSTTWESFSRSESKKRVETQLRNFYNFLKKFYWFNFWIKYVTPIYNIYGSSDCHKFNKRLIELI